MKEFGYKRMCLIATLAMSLVLSGCRVGEEEQKVIESSTLKIMYYNEETFYSQMGRIYNALHPEMSFKIVPVSDSMSFTRAKLDKFLIDEQPDILLLSKEQLTRYGEEGKLLELDMLTEDKAYKKDTIIPGLLDHMKELGDGKIYGIPSGFSSQAVYYNKDLFSKYSIPIPEDRMSWNQLLELAQRFPTDGDKDKRFYGLALGDNGGDLYQLAVNHLGIVENLSFVNAINMKVTIDTPAWINVFETAIKAIKSGSLYTAPNILGNSLEEYLLNDPFLTGKAAMKIHGSLYMQFIEIAQSQMKDKVIQNWDVVTVPVNPQRQDTSATMSFNEILAVNAKSANAEAAIDFIRYVTGEEYAQASSKSNRLSGFPIRTPYLKEDANHNMQAFYSLLPMQNSLYKDTNKLPESFLALFSSMAQEELQGILEDKKTLDEALARLQTRAQQALDQEIVKEKNKPSSEGETVTTGSE